MDENIIMPGNEDMILPDDFTTEAATPQADNINTQQIEGNAEETKPAETQQEQTQQQAIDKIKVKFNHEEKEIPIEEAQVLVQKGMNYDKVTEQLNNLKNDPRLQFVEQLANENNMTVEQYLEAVQEQRKQQELNELIEKNIPEDIAKEILESRKDREQRKTQEQARAKEQEQEKDMQAFLEAYPDVKVEDIPDEVFTKAKQGIPLRYAYMEHELKGLKTQMSIYKQNEQNAKRTPVGGVTAHGAVDPAGEDPFMQGFNSI